ncbi:MAG: hypothetical protein JO256_00895 [Alphaproteobacteria bacterium]|nr:hypothetical protein [Alphaproteobacteria bacterium]
MPKILLVSTVKWPSLARYAGGFVAAGCIAEAVVPAGAPAHLSRYVSHVYRYDAFSPTASLSRAISDSQADLLVACDDRAVEQLLHLHRIELARVASSEIARLIEKSLGKLENYPRLLSRHQSLTTLQAAGVRIPDPHAIFSEQDLAMALERVGLPAVIKADGSWGGDGVVIARSLDAALGAFRQFFNPPSRLRSLLRAAKRRDPHFLTAALSPHGVQVCVQRFIPGLPAASAFAAWRGEVVGAFYYDVLVADGGIGPPNVIRRIDCPQMENASRVAAREFGLSGLHGLDFIRDSDGNVHVLEINPRATHGGTLPFGPGRDLPAALAEALTGAKTGMRSPIKNDVVALFPREWNRDPLSEYLTSGYHDVPWDDPKLLRTVIG